MSNEMNTPVTQNYDENSIQVLEGLEAVRKRPGMYIGSTGERGLHHLVYEIVDNSIDEALAGYCDKITVIINEGDTIGIIDKEIVLSERERMDAAHALASKLLDMPEKFIINDNMIVPPVAEYLSETVDVLRGPNIKPFPKCDAMNDSIECEELIAQFFCFSGGKILENGLLF